MNLLRTNDPADRQLIGKPELTLLGIAALCISAVQWMIGKRNDTVGPILAPGEVEPAMAMAYEQGQHDHHAVVMGDPGFFGLAPIEDGAVRDGQVWHDGHWCPIGPGYPADDDDHQADELEPDPEP